MQKNKIIEFKMEYYVTWSTIQNLTYDFRKSKIIIDLLRKDESKKNDSNFHCIEFLGVSNFCSFEHYENFDYKESIYLNDFTYANNKHCSINIISNNDREIVGNKDINIYIEIGECALYLKANKLKINEEIFELE